MPRMCGVASAMAVRQITWVWSVGSSSVRWRVTVSKCESRTLTLTVAALQAGRAEAPGDALGEGQQGALELLGIARVDGEGVLVADRLRLHPVADG